jgi:hypothetical protein
MILLEMDATGKTDDRLRNVSCLHFQRKSQPASCVTSGMSSMMPVQCTAIFLAPMNLERQPMKLAVSVVVALVMMGPIMVVAVLAVLAVPVVPVVLAVLAVLVVLAGMAGMAAMLMSPPVLTYATQETTLFRYKTREVF